jgi:hypothetical protein
VILNLLAFNAYAFMAASPQMNRHFPTQSQQSIHSDCQHMAQNTHLLMESAEVMAGDAGDHVMPCCKHMHSLLSGHDNFCGCKAGACGAAQLVAVASSFLYGDVQSSGKVDAMSTMMLTTKRGQRMLRPPIY